MSSEFLPEDNAGQRRYRLWRDLSAAAPSPAEDFVARAALNSGGQRIQPDGLNQFRSEYSSEGTAARREEPPERD